ncbi:MAG: response regulator transcription factor [Burkholderiales bacterium]
MQILIVEDERKIAEVLRRGFLEERYQADIAFDGEEALYKFAVNSYDLVVLDLMIPKVNGIEVCRKIRERNSGLPVLMLTARDAIEDKVAGLDAGADDYLTKPFSFMELLARIRALLRRGKTADPAVMSMGNLVLNPATKGVSRGSHKIELTAREFALLEYFMRYPNVALTRTRLLEHVWDCNYDGLSNVVETYVKYLRKKIRTSATDPELIHTLRGSGYMLRFNDDV